MVPWQEIVLTHGVLGWRVGQGKGTPRMGRSRRERERGLKRHLVDGGIHSTRVIWGETPWRRLPRRTSAGTDGTPGIHKGSNGCAQRSWLARVRRWQNLSVNNTGRHDLQHDVFQSNQKELSYSRPKRRTLCGWKEGLSWRVSRCLAPVPNLIRSFPGSCWEGVAPKYCCWIRKMSL